MVTLGILFILFLILFGWKLHDSFHEVSTAPAMRPTAYKIVVVREENQYGDYDIKYYPMEKTMMWSNIMVFNNGHFDPFYTYNLASAVDCLLKRQEMIDNHMEIKIENI